MAHGKLRAIGSSIRLKSKFGAGYRISVVTDPQPDAMTRAKALITANAPSLTLEDDSAGALIFNLPTEQVVEIPPLVKYLDADPDGIVRAWGLSQATLEEVFLALIRGVEGRLDKKMEEQMKTLKRRASVAPMEMAAGNEGKGKPDGETTEVANGAGDRNGIPMRSFTERIDGPSFDKL